MKRKLQKGFTLVELIVVMILMGILMTAVVMILRPSQNTFRNITNKAYEEQTALNISKLLNGSLRYSTGVKVVCNDGSTPTEAEIGGHKSYIKLINDYRDFTDVDKQAYHKGARGNFERGRVKDGSLTALSSAVTRASFDDYDFQFSIPEYNSKDAEASMTIAIKAMPMNVGTEEEQEVAANIKKPNPSFVPQWEKYYTYSETFEFINIRNKDTINRKTTGISVDTYNAGVPVTGLGDGKEYYDPRGTVGSTKVDNTIWIFYTNPQESEMASPGSTGGPGGTPAATTGGEGEGGSTTEGGTTTPGGGSSTGGSSTGGSTGGENNVENDPALTGGSTTGGDTNGGENTGGENTGGETTTGGTTGENPENGDNNNNNNNNNEPKYGSVRIHMLGKSGDAYNYNINVSWSEKQPSTSHSLSVSGTNGSVTINPVYPESVFTIGFSGDGQSFSMTGGYSCDSTYMENKEDIDKYFYKGTIYDTEAEAAAARDGSVPPNTVTFYGTVTIHVIGSTNGTGQYYMNNQGLKNSGTITGNFSEKDSGDIILSAVEGNNFWLGHSSKGELFNFTAESRKGKENEEYWLYKGVKYTSEADALNAKAADEAAAGGGSGTGSGSGTVSASVGNKTYWNEGKGQYDISLKSTSSNPVSGKLVITYKTDVEEIISVWADNINGKPTVGNKSKSGKTVTIELSEIQPNQSLNVYVQTKCANDTLEIDTVEFISN